MAYTGYKNIENFYDNVRVELSATQKILADDVIDLASKAPRAESILKSIISDWETLDEEKIKKFELAVIIKTAIICYNSVYSPNIKSEQIPTIKREYNGNGAYLTMLNGELNGLLKEIDNSYSPIILSMFRVTR